MGEMTSSDGDRYYFNDDEETRDAVFERVMQYFRDFECFEGESIHQSDDPQIYAPDVMSDIADKILQFRWIKRDCH